MTIITRPIVEEPTRRIVAERSVPIGSALPVSIPVLLERLGQRETRLRASIRALRGDENKGKRAVLRAQADGVRHLVEDLTGWAATHGDTSTGEPADVMTLSEYWDVFDVPR